MSRDWEIKCVTCDKVHGFDDANHRVELMRHIIAHADAVAALAPLMATYAGYAGDIELRTNYGSIDPTWFAAHRGHALLPVDEYGMFDGQCTKDVSCAACATRHACALCTGHTGACVPKTR